MPAQPNSDEPVAALDAVETDAGPPRAGKAASRDPERRCIATMERRPQGQLIRFVLSPDAQVTPDIAARLPGRGAWVTANRETLDIAIKRGAFARAFKAQVKLPADLSTLTETMLVRRALDMLGMAKRSGELISGFEQVREAVRASRPACMIEAAEVSADQRGKVLGLVKAIYGPDPDGIEENRPLPPVADCFSGDEMGMALGRERVVHACLKQGRIAHTWMGELARLSGFRRVWLPGWEPASAPEPGASGQDIDDLGAQDSGENSPG
ncbi:MAG: RNA-binding protein [Hyphomonadaceae bacterium]